MRAKSLRRAEGKRESMKPVIGIIAACTREVHPAYTTGHDYVRAVERAGGLALLLPATPDAVSAGMAQWLALCGGFVLPGGGDVAPTYYGQSPVPQLTSTDRLRDNVELTLCRAAAQHKKPLLGICRGAQVLNVAFGGHAVAGHPRAVPGGHLPLSGQCGARRTVPQPDAGAGQPAGAYHGAGAARVQHVSPPGGAGRCAGLCGGGTRAGRPCGGGGKRGRPCAGRTVAPENLAPEHPDHAAIFTWLVDAAAGGALLKR